MITRVSLDHEWRKNFCMTREKFYILCERLRLYLLPGKTLNCRFLSVEKGSCDIVLLTLYCDTGSSWMTANSFGIYRGTVFKNLLEVCSAVSKYLGPKYLNLPSTKQKCKAKSSNLKQGLGWCRHLDLLMAPLSLFWRPGIDSQGYFNNKKFYSLNI